MGMLDKKPVINFDCPNWRLNQRIDIAIGRGAISVFPTHVVSHDVFISLQVITIYLGADSLCLMTSYSDQIGIAT